MISFINRVTLIRALNFWLPDFIINYVWLQKFKSLCIIIPRSFCSALTCKVLLPNSIDSLFCLYSLLSSGIFPTGDQKLILMLLPGVFYTTYWNCHLYLPFEAFPKERPEIFSFPNNSLWLYILNTLDRSINIVPAFLFLSKSVSLFINHN